MNILDNKNNLTNLDLIHSGNSDSMGYTSLNLLLIGLLVLFGIFGTKNGITWSIIGILSILLIFAITLKKRMSFFKTYIQIEYPLNPWKSKVIINKTDITNIKYTKHVYKQISSSIVFYTKDKRFNFISVDTSLLERLQKNYQNNV